jgi:hypothetical protein
VPVEGHIEQEANGFDISSHGIGINAGEFEFSRFIDYIESSSVPASNHREWWIHENGHLLEMITRIAGGETRDQHRE